MMRMIDRLDAFRDGGNVSRFHTRTLIKPQDNAQHSFNCAMIAHEIARYFADVDPYSVVMAMLVHDIPEVAIGDSPHDTKHYNPDIKKALEVAEEAWFTEKLPEYKHFQYDLTENEDYVCKLADQLEALFKTIEEVDLGNRTMGKCAKYIHSHITLNMQPPVAMHTFKEQFDYIMNTTKQYLEKVHNIHVRDVSIPNHHFQWPAQLR